MKQTSFVRKISYEIGEKEEKILMEWLEGNISFREFGRQTGLKNPQQVISILAQIFRSWYQEGKIKLVK